MFLKNFKLPMTNFIAYVTWIFDLWTFTANNNLSYEEFLFD